MPLIPKHKLVFQHIPKTGGTAICKAFGVELTGHLHINHYYDEIKSNYPESEVNDWKIFTVVRNPIARFISAWKMYKYPGNKSAAKEAAIVTALYPQLFDLKDINDFIEMIASDRDGSRMILKDKAAPHFWTTSSFICSATTNELDLSKYSNEYIREHGLLQINYPSYVLRYEMLQHDLNLLAEKEQFEPLKLSVSNRSNHHDKITLTDRSEMIVEHIYDADFETCNKLIQNRSVAKVF